MPTTTRIRAQTLRDRFRDARVCLRCTQWRLAKLMCSPSIYAFTECLKRWTKNEKRFVSEISDLVSRRSAISTSSRSGEVWRRSTSMPSTRTGHERLRRFDRVRAQGVGTTFDDSCTESATRSRTENERADTRPWLRLSGGRTCRFRPLKLLARRARFEPGHNGVSGSVQRCDHRRARSIRRSGAYRGS